MTSRRRYSIPVRNHDAARRAGFGAGTRGADLRRPARRNRNNRQELSHSASRGFAGRDGGAGKAAAGRRCGEASPSGQGEHRHAFQLAASGRAWQPAGQRHHGRVLRLQLWILQTRPARYARSVEGRRQSQIRAQGIPGSGRGLGRGCAGRGRRAHAGQHRQEVHRVSSEAARQPRTRSTRRARWRSPRMSVSTWRVSRRTWAATRSRRRSTKT